jgi:eukaryotic-like serine/threonine-protein kinase
MDQILKVGQTVCTESSGMQCEVEQFLGGGGQGEVYRTKLGGKPVALKWYFPTSATPEQRSALKTLVKKGSPNEKFLWPMELTSAAGVPGFGYIMPLREARYKGLVDMMKRRVEPSFRVLATAGLNLAFCYFELHAKGFCHPAISLGSVFFDPKTGDVLIADSDAVVLEGDTKTGVLGTPRLMAPEAVRGEGLPSRQTDLYSLAVLLFYMFMMHHPLEGNKESSLKALDFVAMTKLYGTEPVFIFDPDDDSNRPVPGYHDNALMFWSIYPQFLRDLFTKAFTYGIRDPKSGRVSETEWQAVMARLRDSIIYCGECAG